MGWEGRACTPWRLDYAFLRASVWLANKGVGCGMAALCFGFALALGWLAFCLVWGEWVAGVE